MQCPASSTEQQEQQEQQPPPPAKGEKPLTTKSKFKPVGKKQLKLRVRSERNLFRTLEDIYVSSLKFSAVKFIFVIFSAPLLLAVLFTPLYLIDLRGLVHGGQNTLEHSEAVAKLYSGGWKALVYAAASGCNYLLHVFLYSLSLSTTFGSAVLVPRSPFILILSNLHTLLTQLLFVFLSGAVFARLSQPADPVKNSDKAIITTNYFKGVSKSDKNGEKVLAFRFVQVGTTTELVDVRMNVVLRYCHAFPSGSVFWQNVELPLVRSEAPIMRHGFTVRHVINKKSPLYKMTKEEMQEGDAAFVFTLVGTERQSMQQIFHLHEYFVHDGDIIWGGEFEDVAFTNSKGMVIIDHSKLNSIRMPDTEHKENPKS